MKIVPMNNHVLCKEVSGTKTESTFDYQHSKLVVQLDSVPIYEVLDLKISSDKKKCVSLKPGDKVIVNSTGTTVNIGKETFMLFSIDSIMGKVV